MFEKFKNKIFTFEGADGTGKDTLVDILHEKLTDSFVVRFPDRTNITGNIINKILKKEIAFPNPYAFQSLMLANKIETLINISRDRTINPHVFLFSRYYESAMIYGLNDGIPVDLSRDINSVLPKSEMTFILDGKKYRADNEHYENTEVQENLANNYRKLAKAYDWNIVDNRRTPTEIADDVYQRILSHMIRYI